MKEFSHQSRDDRYEMQHYVKGVIAEEMRKAITPQLMKDLLRDRLTLDIIKDDFSDLGKVQYVIRFVYDGEVIAKSKILVAEFNDV